MTILYDPKKLLKKIAPEKKVARLVNQNLTPNKAILSMFDDIDFISKKDIQFVALKTIRSYKRRYKENRKEGLSVSEATAESLNNKRQLINRVQNEVVSQVAQEIKESYHGQKYIWLPSDADEPDPQHQLNYGKVFTIGDGEMPGDRYGCRCAMEILVKDEELNL